MTALRVLILMVVVMMAPAVSTSAQDALGEPSSINPVAAAIAADHQTKCDEIGWGVLPEQFDGNTLAVPFVHYGTCHHGVGAVFFGGCIEPFPHELMPEDVPLGKTEVFCTVSVTAVEDFGVTVDPADFYLIDDQDRSYGAMAENFTLPIALKLTTLEQNAVTGGRVFFTVDSPLTVPFLLVWFPSSPPDQRLAAIIIDQPVPWEDAGNF